MKNNSLSISFIFSISLFVPLHALGEGCRFSGEAMQGIDDLYYYIKEDIDEFNLLCATRLPEQSFSARVSLIDSKLKELEKLKKSVKETLKFGNKIKRQWDEIRYNCDAYSSDENESRARNNRNTVKDQIRDIKKTYSAIGSCKKILSNKRKLALKELN